MGGEKHDAAVQEEDIPLPSYGGQLTLMSSGTDVWEAVFTGGIIQPNMNCSNFEILTQESIIIII